MRMQAASSSRRLLQAAHLCVLCMMRPSGQEVPSVYSALLFPEPGAISRGGPRGIWFMNSHCPRGRSAVAAWRSSSKEGDIAGLEPELNRRPELREPRQVPHGSASCPYPPPGGPVLPILAGGYNAFVRLARLQPRLTIQVPSSVFVLARRPWVRRRSRRRCFHDVVLTLMVQLIPSFSDRRTRRMVPVWCPHRSSIVAHCTCCNADESGQ
ncbi:hypothetical protein FKP32DRAFT_223826 [Trametes sanguinea]|nr:hypothetical protein FKP32DRAFT_223826 [Trametes sanguinea]